ncbi:MAG TPA: hypothetical protein ENI73_01840 [Spirochaetes bacterium]|nr:hypothetical protein [Spirochaetota bacterium]
MNIRNPLLLVVLIFIASVSWSKTMTEKDKIQTLLNRIEESKYIFIRNGKEYSAQKAREHLEMKYNRMRKKIKTANDFIDRLATKSSLSGKPYLMKNPANGKKTLLRIWLKAQLRLMEKNK